MKKPATPFLLFSFILATSSLSAQAFEWANHPYGGDAESTSHITTDPVGNVLVTASFAGSVDVDPSAGTLWLTSAPGARDLYLQKQNSSGNLLWALHFQGDDWVESKEVYADGSGNTYITGLFRGSVDMDPGAGTVNYTSLGGTWDAFLVKVDASGNYLWSLQLGASGDDMATSVTTDASGDVYMAGTAEYSVDFDPGAGTTYLTDAGSTGMGFLAKYSSSGALVWAGNLDGPEMTAAGRIVSMASDGTDLFMTGTYMDSVDFDPGAGTSWMFLPGGLSATFLARYDGAGSLIWVKGLGDINALLPYAADVDASGNLIVSGRVNGPVDMDPGAGTALLDDFGGYDAFLLKIDPAGNYVWARNFGSAYVDESWGLATGPDDEVYFTGWIGDDSDFDPGPGTYTLPCSGSAGSGASIFLARVNASGNLAWAFSLGDSLWSRGTSVACDGSGTVYTTGYFDVRCDFDPSPAAMLLMTDSLGTDNFVLAVSQDSCSGLTVVVDSIVNITCTTSAGYISVSGDRGVPGYAYSWSTVPVSIDSFLTVNTPGLYMATIVDAIGCETERTFVMSGPAYTSGFDLWNSLSAPGFRTGINTPIQLLGMNDGCTPVNGSLRLVPDPGVTITYASPSPDYMSADTMVWDFTGLFYDSGPILPVLNGYTTASIGDTVCFWLSITPAAGDLAPLNNTVTLCFPVTASYDPNGITVSPQGECEEHFVSKSEPLTYTIGFQNTGTSEAMNVYLIDSLSAYLDPSTVTVKAHSHDMHTEMLPDNVLRFVFSNINLPDSSTDEPGSHGFVTYAVMPQASAADGSQVYNHADIYFDFNMPVSTPAVMNTLMDVVPPCTPEVITSPADDLGLLLYPNPASGLVTLSASDPIGPVVIMNTMGKVILHTDAKGQSEVTLHIEGLNAGMYFVSAVSGVHTWVRKLVVN